MESLFFRCFLGVAFFQAETLLGVLQLASNRKPESPNGARKATRAPRRAFANENPRDKMIQEICEKIYPNGEPKSHDNPEESIENKEQPQPENRLPEPPQRPPEVPRGRPEAPESCPEAAKGHQYASPPPQINRNDRPKNHTHGRWSHPRALVTPPGRSRCVELAASNSLCCVSVPGPAECAKRLNKVITRFGKSLHDCENPTDSNKHVLEIPGPRCPSYCPNFKAM